MTLRRILMVAAVLAATFLPAATAHADPGGGGGSDGAGSYYAFKKSRVSFSGSGYKGRPRIPVDVDPPHCWYQPEYNYAGMMDWARRIYFVWHHQGPEDQVDASEWYKKTIAEINKHQGETDKVFWFLTNDGTDAGWGCYVSTEPFWMYVAPGRPPVAGDKIIDTHDLALMARANLTLPKTRIARVYPPRKNGVYRTYVGLRTWLEIPRPAGPLDVTATVRGYPALTATVTATPLRLVIKADSGLAHVGATCPEYQKGAADGCWVEFKRSSLGGRFTITVTQVWRVTSNVGVTFPDAEISDTTTVVVDEIQSTAGR